MINSDETWLRRIMGQEHNLGKAANPRSRRSNGRVAFRVSHVLSGAFPSDSTVSTSREFLIRVKGISRWIRELRHFWVSSVWLHSDRVQQLHSALLGGIRHRGHLERGSAALSEARLAGIAHDGGEFVEQRAEAVHG